MSITDRKLLEMAAKAAEIGGAWEWPRGAKAPTYWRDADGKAWNPLTDDGDALRLAVKLDIDLIRESLDDVPSTPTHVKAQSWDLEFSASEALGDDPYAATRRAIVRAAAEIGRAMP
jgi:hypothetical protein